MAITEIDKITINKYLNSHALGDIYYLDLRDCVCKRKKINDFEFLEYFINQVVTEFQKNTKISVKLLSKYIHVTGGLLYWGHEAGIEVKEELLDKIRSFKEFYDEYLERNSLEPDSEFVNNCINMITETVDKLYPSEKKGESVAKYINKINELEKETKSLKKKLEEINNLYKSLQTSSESNMEQVNSLNSELINLRRENKSNQNKVNKFSEEIRLLNEKVDELTKKLDNVNAENSELKKYQEQCENLLNEVERLTKQIEEELSRKKEIEDLKIKHKEIESFIYQKLLFERVSLDEILNYVKEQGFATDRNEVATLLRRIRSRINIESSSFSLSPTYRIVAPTLVKDGEFAINIPNGCKHYDIMLVSDFHIRSVDNKILTGFDILNDYCVKNGINLILNLGDFYHGYGNLNYNDAIKNYKIVENSILLLPKVDGLYHAILGGNHDKNVIKYGFDPIKFLSDEREDFINLGYTHSTIVLTEVKKVLGTFDIHHPDTFDFPIDLDENGIDINCLDGYLRDIYNKQSRNRDNSYIDIFGHTHKSQFNYPGSYCYIPSFFDGHMKKGACHLRIYFDEDTKIKYMVFIPLTATNQLVPNNEIIYKKVLRK